MEEKKSPRADIHRLRLFLFSVSLTLVLIVVIILFSWKTTTDGDRAQLRIIDAAPEEVLEIPATEQLPPPPPQKITAVEIIEVPDEEEVKEEIHISLDLEEEQPMEAIVPIEAEEKEEESDEIMVIVEKNAEYPGGREAMLRFLVENMKYPPQAKRMGIEGKVFVQVVIEKDGSITDPIVLKGIGGGCDEEAMRVIKAFPRWIPAKQRGRPVRAKIVFPIVFKLH